MKEAFAKFLYERHVQEPMAPNTLRAYEGTFARFESFRYSREVTLELPEANPFRHVLSSFRVGKEEMAQDKLKRQELTLTEEEVKRLLRVNAGKFYDGAHNLSRPREFYASRDRLIMKLLASSGMRISEVCQVNMESLNLRKQYVELPYSKNGEPRWIDISRAMEEIGAYLALRGMEPGPLFLNNFGGRLSPAGARTIVNRLLREAGLYRPGRSCHKLRHAYITDMVARGKNVSLVAAHVGNSVMTIQRVYFNPSRERILRGIRSDI